MKLDLSWSSNLKDQTTVSEDWPRVLHVDAAGMITATGGAASAAPSLSGWDLSALLGPNGEGMVVDVLNPLNRDQSVVLSHPLFGEAAFRVTILTDSSGEMTGALLDVAETPETPVPAPFQTALRASAIALWALDRATDRLDLSENWADLWGLTPGPCAMTTLRQALRCVHVEDRRRVRLMVSQLVRGQRTTLSLRFRVRGPQGGWQEHFLTGEVTAYDGSGRPMSIVGSDMRREEISSEVAEPEDPTDMDLRRRVAFECAEQGIWDNDIAAGRTYVSASWKEMRGLPMSAQVEPGAESWLATVHPDDVPRMKAQIRLHNAGVTDIVNKQYRTRHSDGSWRWILSRGRIIARFPDGRIKRAIGTDTDITDIKAIEHQATMARERLQVAMAAYGIALWEFNPNTGETWWDDRMLDIYGLPAGQNIRDPKEWEQFLHPEDRNQTIAQVNDCRERNVDLTCEYRILRQDGQVRCLRVRARRFDPAGQGVYVGVCLDITAEYERSAALESARRQLEHESRHDALTGLANRRRLDEAMFAAVAKQDRRSLAVLHIDLDHFKEINDTLGHAAGDAVLVHMADILREVVRDRGLVARVGGDEFVVLADPAPSAVALGDMADEIIRRAREPFHYNGSACWCGVSIGIASSMPVNGRPVDLFVNADLALYRAKHRGRGQVCFFREEMRHSAFVRKARHDDLRAGLDRQEIMCHYQPQFDAKTRRIVGLEALVRWDNQRDGVLGPERILDSAREIGLLQKVDAEVFRVALRDMQAWRTAGIQVPRIAINVSSERLHDDAFAAHIAAADFGPGDLSFELLESVYMDAIDERLRRNLAAARNLGIEIEIDDFGTGHSSIVSLMEIKPNRVKIDQRLVVPAVMSPRKRRILGTVIEIGHMHCGEVIAEGVESEAHAQIAARMGCDVLQGFGLSPAMSAADIARLLS